MQQALALRQAARQLAERHPPAFPAPAGQLLVPVPKECVPQSGPDPGCMPCSRPGCPHCGLGCWRGCDLWGLLCCPWSATESRLGGYPLYLVGSFLSGCLASGNGIGTGTGTGIGIWTSTVTSGGGSPLCLAESGPLYCLWCLAVTEVPCCPQCPDGSFGHWGLDSSLTVGLTSCSAHCPVGSGSQEFGPSGILPLQQLLVQRRHLGLVPARLAPPGWVCRPPQELPCLRPRPRQQQQLGHQRSPAAHPSQPLHVQTPRTPPEAVGLTLRSSLLPSLQHLQAAQSPQPCPPAARLSHPWVASHLRLQVVQAPQVPWLVLLQDLPGCLRLSPQGQTAPW
mmetsp:Transcript_78716/g.132015  ORF Transcript_78716/g.132015 Transcript_78716/m.132015 type:complete len:338 (-) Transcript_78716:2056-3069(-)